MLERRLTLVSVCVLAALASATACAGHVAPPARAGDIAKTATTTATAKTATTAKTAAATAAPSAAAATTIPPALAALTKDSPVPASVRALPKALLLDVQLDQAISGATPIGYAFSTKVAQAITAKDGSVAIPAGAVIRGVVTGVRAGTGSKPSVICLNLDFMELGGRDYGIRSSVKDVLVNDKPEMIFPRDSIAAIFPNDPAGQFEGTAIAIASTAATDAAPLPVGTRLIVRLDSAIAVLR
ncbi:MAG TPA: hypothetical protein VGM82_04660 [Gemmatimonadaceae bacterium]|jgi:hypothetical protein